MSTDPNCIFCKIVAGEIPCHKVFEDEDHLAFLSIFPNTPGVTVVIPKEHHDSYVFAVPDDVRHKLIDIAKHVALKIDRAFDDVGRTGLVFEGFGVNHLHAKLYPLHGTNSPEWTVRNSINREFFEAYPGYISTHDCAEGDHAELAKIAERIRAA